LKPKSDGNESNSKAKSDKPKSNSIPAEVYTQLFQNEADKSTVVAMITLWKEFYMKNHPATETTTA